MKGVLLLIGCNTFWSWYNPRAEITTTGEEVKSMAVKVIIERRVTKGKDMDLANLMRDLRAKAMFTKGYISGETLRDHEDPTLYITISTWKSYEDWKAWEESEVRKEMQAKIDTVLENTALNRVFDFA
jgi:heme-degrading monooxygenase HmoA